MAITSINVSVLLTKRLAKVQHFNLDCARAGFIICDLWEFLKLKGSFVCLAWYLAVLEHSLAAAAPTGPIAQHKIIKFVKSDRGILAGPVQQLGKAHARVDKMIPRSRDPHVFWYYHYAICCTHRSLSDEVLAFVRVLHTRVCAANANCNKAGQTCLAPSLYINICK